MGILDDPIDEHGIENLRRSIAMLAAGQPAPIDRERALALLDELQRLQATQRAVVGDLRAVLDRLDR